MTFDSSLGKVAVGLNAGSAILYCFRRAWRMDATNTASPSPIATNHRQQPAAKMSATSLRVRKTISAASTMNASNCTMPASPGATTAQAANPSKAMTDVSRSSQSQGRW